MDKSFAVIVDSPASAEVYELGRVIKRAVSAGHKEATLFMSGIDGTLPGILRKQMDGLDYVYAMTDNAGINYINSQNTDSVCLNIDDDKTGVIANQAVVSISEQDFLVIVTNDVSKMSKLSLDAMSACIDMKKKIYIIDNSTSNWSLPPGYSKEIMKSYKASSESQVDWFDDGADSSGAYEEVKSTVMQETVERYKKGYDNES